MKSWISAVVAVTLAGAAWAQDGGKKPDPAQPEAKKQEAPKAEGKTDGADATEILKKADDATKKVKSVRYVATCSGSAGSTALPKIKGTWILGGEKSESNFGRFKIEAKLSGPDGDSEVTAGFDGNDFWMLDPKTKTAYVDVEDAVLGRRGGTLLQFTFREFTHPNPFGDEINGVKKELRGTKDINGEKCHEVFVEYRNGGGATATWFFSVKDSLPRRVDRTIPRGGGGASLTTSTEISELAVDPTFAADPYKLVLPEGYTKTDKTAP